MDLLLRIVLFVSLIAGHVTGVSPSDGVFVYAYDGAVGLVLLAAMIRNISQHKRQYPRLAWHIMGFTAIGIGSLLLNNSRFIREEIGYALLYLVRWNLYAGLYWVSAFSGNLSVWYIGLYGAGLGVAVLGLVQLWLYPDLRNLYYLGWDPHFRRLFSTLLDPNFAGLAIVLTFFLGLFLYPRIMRKHLLIFPQTILVLALLLTYSRSSYLAFFGGMIVYIIWEKSNRAKNILRIGVVLLAVVLLSGQTEGQRLTRSVSVRARIDNFTKAAALVRGSPIVGYGFNTLRFVQENASVQTSSAIPSRASSGVDNSILFLLVTAGVVGTAYYLWLLTHMARIANSSSLTASFVAILVHSMFVNSLLYPWVMIWLWIIVGAREQEGRKS